MLRITILQVGKTKEPALESLVIEYTKRLSSSVKLQWITTKTEDELWKKVPAADEIIAMEVEGESLHSQAFAQWIEDSKNQGKSHLVFLIGPAEGFKDYQKPVTKKLSLSKMTFSHQTVRLLLIEQIYRSITILEGKPFAK